MDSWYEYQLTKKIHGTGRKLVYIIDDDLLAIRPEISSAAYYGQNDVQGFIRGMIEMSDAIISPSPVLLERYVRDGRLAIRVEEPAIDPVPFELHDSNAPVKIGFAGSIDRKGDIEKLLGDVLFDIKQKYGNRVQFEFFGAIPSFAAELDANTIPYCHSYDAYRRILNDLRWDIGLAPMPDTPFHACKHYNKFVEYAAAGIVGIYSDVMPYTQLRGRKYEPILCVNNTKVWTEALSRLIESADRENMRRNLCALCEGPFSVRETSLTLLSYLDELDGETEPHMDGNWQLGKLKCGNVFWRGKSIICQYKLGVFPKVFGRLCNVLKGRGKTRDNI